MRRIYKYTITNMRKERAKTNAVTSMPVDRKIIAVGAQDGEVVVWAEVNPGNRKQTSVEFIITWTGDCVPDGKYLGTVTIDGLVYHVYGGHNE